MQKTVFLQAVARAQSCVNKRHTTTKQQVHNAVGPTAIHPVKFGLPARHGALVACLRHLLLLHCLHVFNFRLNVGD